jgi:hypothetical protein
VFKNERIINHESFKLRNLNEFIVTETELTPMAAAAIMGESKMPGAGYKTPAAIGSPAHYKQRLIIYVCLIVVSFVYCQQSIQYLPHSKTVLESGFNILSLPR